MTITLTPEQQDWIDAHVARGDYASAEEATRVLLDDAIARRTLADDDLGWAKPLVDEALAEVERGETISWEDSCAELAAIVASFETRWPSSASRAPRSAT